jgi:hypothetical protein
LPRKAAETSGRLPLWGGLFIEGRARSEGSGLGEASFADVKPSKLGVQRPVAALAKG